MKFCKLKQISAITKILQLKTLRTYKNFAGILPSLYRRKMCEKESSKARNWHKRRNEQHDDTERTQY